MAAPRFPRAWLLYATLLTAAVVIGEVSNLFRGEPFTLLKLADWIVTVALLTATWGYAMQRSIGSEPYWRKVFWLLMVASGLMLLRVMLASAIAFVIALVFAAFVVPAYVATYLYAYRSPQLWRSAARGDSPG